MNYKRKHPTVNNWNPYDSHWTDLTKPQTESVSQANYYSGGSGDNTRYTKFLVEVQRIAQKADVQNITSLQQCFVEYLQLCAEWDIKIGNINAYMAMGIDKDTAFQWYHGQDPEKKKLIEDVKRMCGAYRENLISDGKLNPVTGIFWQKNFDGLTDVQTHAVAAIDALGEKKSANEILEKYAMLPDD